MSPARSLEAMQAGVARRATLDRGPAADLAVIEPAAIVPAGERGRLAECEAAVDRHMHAAEDAARAVFDAFVAAGKALAEIRDHKLYKADGYTAFEEYTKARWGMGHSHAYRLMDEWQLGEKLSPLGERLTERHVRELMEWAKQRGPDAALAVVQEIAEAAGGPVPLKALRAYVSERQPAAGPAPFRAARVTALIRELGDLAAAGGPDDRRWTAAGMRAKADEIERGDG